MPRRDPFSSCLITKIVPINPEMVQNKYVKNQEKSELIGNYRFKNSTISGGD